MAPIRFAGDQNLPEPVLAAIEPFLGFEVARIRNIDPRLIDRLDDWEVLLALSQLGYEGLVTLDHNMLSLPKEMAVVHQTNLTVVAIESVTHDPLQAMGELMVHARNIVQCFDPDRPQVFEIRRRRYSPPESAWDRLGRIASHEGSALMELFNASKVSDTELDEPVLANDQT